MQIRKEHRVSAVCHTGCVSCLSLSIHLRTMASLGDLADVVVEKLQEMDDHTWTSPLCSTTLRCTSGSWAAKDSPVSCQTTVDHKTAQGTTYVLSVRQRARRSRQDTALRFKEAGLALEAMASVISDFESGANLLHVSEWMWFT